MTNIKELNLSARVEDKDGIDADITIETEGEKTYAAFNIKYNNTGRALRAYFAKYDETNALVSVKSSAIESGDLRLELPSGGNYKAFMWYENNEPVCESVSNP